MKKHRYKGFTLVELIITIALLSIVITAATSGIVLLFKSHALTVDEYTLQSSIRNTSSKITEVIRYSQAVFAVPKEYISDVSKMDPEWDYIALSADKQSIIKYRYNVSTLKHEKEILVDAQPNIEYEILFKKQSAETKSINGVTTILNDNVLFFNIEAYVISTDESGNTVRTNRKVVYESELEATNALQVVDKGTLLSPSVALAYRKDDNTYGEGRSHVVKIALILDVSGSMAWIPGVNDVYPSGTSSSRLTHLKRALIGNGLDGSTGIIAQFAAYPNFEITLVPFSNQASYIVNNARGIPFYNAQAEKSALVTRIKNLTANGNTNTGDGIRLSYYNMKNFTATGYNANVEQHDFTIILVDGDSNNYSWVVRNGTNYYHRWADTVYNVDNNSGNAYTYVTKLGETIFDEFGYTGDYYLIGYVTNPSSTGVQNIKDGLRIPTEQVYMYNSSNFDLSEVFSNIATDIMAKTWLVTGPQIKN